MERDNETHLFHAFPCETIPKKTVSCRSNIILEMISRKQCDLLFWWSFHLKWPELGGEVQFALSPGAECGAALSGTPGRKVREMTHCAPRSQAIQGRLPEEPTTVARFSLQLSPPTAKMFEPHPFPHPPSPTQVLTAVTTHSWRVLYLCTYCDDWVRGMTTVVRLVFTVWLIVRSEQYGSFLFCSIFLAVRTQRCVDIKGCHGVSTSNTPHSRSIMLQRPAWKDHLW